MSCVLSGLFFYSNAFISVFGNNIVKNVHINIAPPIVKNGGKQPHINKYGNIKLPNITPIRPNTFTIDSVIALKKKQTKKNQK